MIVEQNSSRTGSVANISRTIGRNYVCQNGKKGIGCGLGNVQKLGDGEPLGGRTDAATDFGGAPANAYAQPATPQGYVQPAAPVYQQPVAPVYPQPAAPQYVGPIDPITGRPINGGVMGL